MHPDKVSLAFGIKIDPHNHTPFTIPRDGIGLIFPDLQDFSRKLDLHSLSCSVNLPCTELYCWQLDTTDQLIS